MKNLIVCLVGLSLWACLPVAAQTADSYFHRAAAHYIDQQTEQAQSLVEEGLTKYPKDAKLTGLSKKLNEQKKDQKDKEKNQQQQQDQKQQKQEQNQQKQEQKPQDNSSKQKGEEKAEQNQNPAQQEQDKRDQAKEKQAQEYQQRLQQLNMSKEKAQMILDAMRQNETQYYQQMRRRTPAKKNGKPDW